MGANWAERKVGWKVVSLIAKLAVNLVGRKIVWKIVCLVFWKAVY